MIPSNKATRHDFAPKQEYLPLTGYVRISQLVKHIPLSKTSIWRLTKLGKFPKPVRLSEKCTAWKAESVQEWLASLEAVREAVEEV